MYEYVYTHIKIIYNFFGVLDCLCSMCSCVYNNPRLMSCMWMKLKGSALFQTHTKKNVYWKIENIFFRWKMKNKIFLSVSYFLCLDNPCHTCIHLFLPYASCLIHKTNDKKFHTMRAMGCSLTKFYCIFLFCLMEKPQSSFLGVFVKETMKLVFCMKWINCFFFFVFFFI
jgi:hypothetical protein